MLACYSNTLYGPMNPHRAAVITEYVLTDPAGKGCADQLDLEVLAREVTLMQWYYLLVTINSRFSCAMCVLYQITLG
jgi:hypothetical protein